MFNQLSDRLKSAFDKITGHGVITEKDVDATLREVRIALLEADVALPATKKLLSHVKEKALGEDVIKSVTPGQQIVKIVNDALVELLGEASPLNLATQPPAVVLMSGLQGSGKTTTAAKLAKHLQEKENKRVLLASADIYRPAAQEQLQTLAEKIGAAFLPIKAGEQPAAIAKRALAEARTSATDVLIFDTAGRLELDDQLMAELKDLKKILSPSETLLVADSLTGQSAAHVAKAFHQAVDVTGIVLTRMDGDGRGGAALSMREVTGKPIKFIGLGEGVEALEPFRPEGTASRILGQGDVVALVEKAAAAVSEDDMAAMQEKMFSGKGMDLNDMRKQLKMMQKMGSMKGLMGMLPGMGKLAKKVDASKLDDKIIIHQIAVIDSMTKAERKSPEILNARRRARIARGAGVEVSTVNKLVKTHQQMQKAMKMMKKMGGPAALQGMMNKTGKGNMPF